MTGLGVSDTSVNVPDRQHPIDSYCDTEQISRSELARRIGRSPQLLSDMVNAGVPCSGPTARALVRETSGWLSYEELLEWQPDEDAA